MMSVVEIRITPPLACQCSAPSGNAQSKSWGFAMEHRIRIVRTVRRDRFQFLSHIQFAGFHSIIGTLMWKTMMR